MTTVRYEIKHVFIIPVLFIAISLFFTLLTGSLSRYENSNFLIFMSMPGHMIIFAYIFIIIGKKDFINDELKFFHRWKDLIPGFFIGLLSFVAALILSVILPQSRQPEFQLVFERVDLLFVLYFLFVSIVAPLIEEFIFRGFLWKILEERGMKKIHVLLITSFLFSIMHMDLYRLPVYFFGGIVYGLLRWKTGHVSRSVVAHVTNNILVSATIFVIPVLLG